MTEAGTSGVMSAVLAESTTPRPSRPPRRYVTSAVSRSIESSFLAATAPFTATRSWAARIAYGRCATTRSSWLNQVETLGSTLDDPRIGTLTEARSFWREAEKQDHDHDRQNDLDDLQLANDRLELVISYRRPDNAIARRLLLATRLLANLLNRRLIHQKIIPFGPC